MFERCGPPRVGWPEAEAVAVKVEDLIVSVTAAIGSLLDQLVSIFSSAPIEHGSSYGGSLSLGNGNPLSCVYRTCIP